MNASNFAARLAAVVALTCVASAAHASFTFSTSTGANPDTAYAATLTNTVINDRFGDLTINSPLNTNSLTRTSGSFAYAISTETSLYTVQSPGIGGSAITVDGVSDSLTFGSFNLATYSMGARFYLSDINSGAALGTSGAPVTLTIRATDVNGATQDFTVGQYASSTVATLLEPQFFFKLGSSEALQSVQLLNFPAANANGYATVDNVVLQAVPTPASWLMMLSGGAVVLRLSARRRS